MKFIKRNISTILLGLVFTVGVILLAYPTFSNWWNSWHAGHLTAGYNQTVENLSGADLDHYFDEAEIYNEALINNPNRYHPTDEETALYNRQLTIEGSQVIGSIEVPSVKISLPIYHGTSEEILEVGAGHLQGTSLPIGGIGSHSVITGHRGLPSAKLFTDLDKVVVDDYVILDVLNRTLTYQIDQIRIVLPSEIETLEIEPDKDLLTLVTCTPYGINTHRLLLTGHRVENLSGDYSGAAEARLLDSKFVAVFIAIPILIALFIYLLVHYRKTEEDDKTEN